MSCITNQEGKKKTNRLVGWEEPAIDAAKRRERPLGPQIKRFGGLRADRGSRARRKQ